jgi:hypothetical protein
VYLLHSAIQGKNSISRLSKKQKHSLPSSDHPNSALSSGLISTTCIPEHNRIY